MSKLRAPQIDTGDGANQIVGLDGSSQLPAVDGSQLTSVDSITLNGVAAGSGANQIVVRDGSGNTDADTLGGQPVGIGANDIIALNGSSQLPAVDGSLLTSLNATNVASGTLNTARLATSGVSAASYNNADITVDSKGRVTAASNGTSASYVSFNARQTVSLQTVGSSTWTKIQFNTERWDTNGYYSTGTYRFTPLLAGKYTFNIRMSFSTGFGMVDGNSLSLGLAKNANAPGGLVSIHSPKATSDGQTMAFTTTVEANGSTDYFEAWVWHNNAGTQRLSNGVELSEFSAVYVGP